MSKDPTKRPGTAIDEKPLATKSQIPAEVFVDDVNRVIRYRDNLKLIPQTLEYDDQGRRLRNEIQACDAYLFQYKQGQLAWMK